MVFEGPFDFEITRVDCISITVPNMNQIQSNGLENMSLQKNFNVNMDATANTNANAGSSA